MCIALDFVRAGGKTAERRTEMALNAVLEKLGEVQHAFEQDFDSMGRMLVSALIEGDAGAEARVKREIRGLHDLRKKFEPVSEEMKRYLVDHRLGAHPEDANRAILAAYTDGAGDGSGDGAREDAAVGGVLPAAQTVYNNAQPKEYTQNNADEKGGGRRDVREIDNRSAETQSEGKKRAPKTTTPPAAELAAPKAPPIQSAPSTQVIYTSKSEKSYNKSDNYIPFFLEAIHRSPFSKISDLQRSAHEMMMNEYVDGTRVGRDGDAQKTNSGVVRYKAQTQIFRKKLEAEGFIEISASGALSLTPSGETRRWGGMGTQAKRDWVKGGSGNKAFPVPLVISQASQGVQGNDITSEQQSNRADMDDADDTDDAETFHDIARIADDTDDTIDHDHASAQSIGDVFGEEGH